MAMDVHRPPPDGEGDDLNQPPATGHPHPLKDELALARGWARWLLALALLVGLPAAALGMGRVAYGATLGATQEAGRAEAATARLTSDARTSHIGPGTGVGTAQVRWTDRSGARHTDVTRVAPDAREGERVRVWTDGSDGLLASPPPTRQDAVLAGWLAAGLTTLSLGALLWLTRGGVLLLLERRVYARWDAEWRWVEPRWSGRWS
ncbi:hypothetical protein [Streptomyces sp. NPDC005438]|uniref:Rv1733c family protein n=1 Tax=Streptomyces sp. NPDC005438 TaxID=3156880 RepID=UPI0033A9E02B